ncbi:UBX domain-containing protein 11 [Protobothrops mucrosquamatus]|uniref:UBX domain-containing protein 11 n=1 Tax=Protobothrops mucrosquamatus TaxID=103944 RepID=UPI0007759C60|nr:UBX domain-containing protein 11 [Protobothrops mucrosquamatus]
MSSPFSSLSKIRRMPLQLQPTEKKAIPLQTNIQNEDEAAMMDEILGPGAQIPVQINLPSCSNGATAQSSMLGNAPSDMELMTSMMQKIASLEQKVKSQAQAIQEKVTTEPVQELPLTYSTFIDRRAPPFCGFSFSFEKTSLGTSRVEELEMLCLQLQRQVWEMERFLNDYGLIWVGEDPDSLRDLESLEEEDSPTSRTFWKPGEAIMSETPIDFDLILKNLKDLNVLAGEGISQIKHTTGGARLKRLDSVPITFYQNGIVMFSGPFRSYEDPSTQRCLQDILDGFFPSELQRRYPSGVPFQVTDKRDVLFRERKLPGYFPGFGQAVGRSRPSGLKETSEISGPKLTMEQFLNKLPKSLVRDGQVIDIREDLKKTLQGLDGAQSHEVVLVETPSLTALRKRLEGKQKTEGPGTNISTLRIKSEDGEKTYIVKMSFTETIGHLRQHLAQNRGEAVEPFEILSTFPLRVYNNDAVSLEECGLVPNAFLLLRKKLPPAKAGEE